jgi:DNA primase
LANEGFRRDLPIARENINMPPRFASELLRSLRNDIPIAELIRSHLDLPAKESEGYFRFLCPRCSDFHTATNPRTNLARCFRCRVNLNPIELVMAVEGCGFVDAVKMLTPLLERYQRRSTSGGKAP